MRETWDQYWGKIETLNVESVIESDSYYHLLKRLMDLPEDKHLNILEVGCGSGIGALVLLKEFQYCPLNATLTDFSSIAIAFAKKNADESSMVAGFVLADAFRLPFPDERFDIVWNEGVNEHCDGEQRRLMSNEMALVCKQGGQVIVIVPNALNPPYRLWKKVLEMQRGWEYGFEKPYSILKLKNEMKNAGLIPTKAGGMKVMSSFFYLAELIAREMVNKAANIEKSAHLGVLRKVFQGTERILEKTLWFAGNDIGIKRVKCG